LTDSTGALRQDAVQHGTASMTTRWFQWVCSHCAGRKITFCCRYPRGATAAPCRIAPRPVWALLNSW